MIKYFFIIIFILLQLQAKSFIYYNELKKENLKEYMSYKFDLNDTIETILEQKDKFEPLKKSHFGFKTQTIWTQLKIENQTSKNQKVTLRNPNNLIGFVDIYIYKENKLLKSYKKGFSQNDKSYGVFNRPNTLNIELSAKSTITIFTKITARANSSVAWSLLSSEKYSKLIILEIVVAVLFASFLFSASAYSFSIYLNTKMREFLYYSAMMFSLLILTYFEKGFWVWVTPNIFSDSAIFLLQIFANIVLILGILFLQTFFDTKRKFKLYNKILSSLIVVYLSFVVVNIYSFKFDNSITYYLLPILLIIIILTYTIFISLGIYATKKRVDGAIFYLLGQGIFLISVMVRLSSKLTGEEDSLNALITSSIGFVFEVIFFSIALGVKLKKLKRDLEKNKKLIEIKSREKAVAKTIGNISHQWKAPLTQVGVLLTKLEFNLEQYPNPKAVDTIHQMNSLVKYMSDITEEYQNLYKSGDKKRIFIKESIDKSLLLLNEKIKESNISIEIIVDKRTSIDSYENALKQVLIIILDNAISIAKIRKVKNPKVVIGVEKIENIIIIEIEDNGGGVKVKPIDKIFEDGVTQKNSEGVGIGLYLARELTQNVLNGELSVENKNSGACFKIELNS